MATPILRVLRSGSAMDFLLIPKAAALANPLSFGTAKSWARQLAIPLPRMAFASVSELQIERATLACLAARPSTSVMELVLAISFWQRWFSFSCAVAALAS